MDVQNKPVVDIWAVCATGTCLISIMEIA
jgi:hypothetical protein